MAVRTASAIDAPWTIYRKLAWMQPPENENVSLWRKFVQSTSNILSKWKAALDKGVKETWGKCCNVAKKSKFPVLEEIGNSTLSLMRRLYIICKFLCCIGFAIGLCWFLEEETMNDPIIIKEESVPVNMGPFPAVAVFADHMFQPEFVAEIEGMLGNDSTEFRKTKCGQFGEKERIAVAFILGQITSDEGAGGHKMLYNICSKFVNDKNQSTFVPTNDPNNDVVKKAICFIKTGLKNCSSVMRKCQYDEHPNPCHDLFKPVLTGKGISCLFNAIPFFKVDKDETIRSAFRQDFDDEIKEYWNGMDMDGLTFSTEARERLGPINYQGIGIRGNGLAYEIVRDLSEEIEPPNPSVVMSHPRDPIEFGMTSIPTEFGNQFYISLDAKGFYCAKANQPKVDEQKRQCRFYSEDKLGVFDGYTFSRCLQGKIYKDRSCAFVDEQGEPDKLGKPLCPPFMGNKTIRGKDEFSRLQNLASCPKSCNDVEYNNILQSVPLGWELSKKGTWEIATIKVHISFPKHQVAVQIKTVKTYTAEIIGIVLGTIGFCNELTLPKLFDITVDLLFYLVSKLLIVVKNGLANRVQDLAT